MALENYKQALKYFKICFKSLSNHIIVSLTIFTQMSHVIHMGERIIYCYSKLKKYKKIQKWKTKEKNFIKSNRITLQQYETICKQRNSFHNKTRNDSILKYFEKSHPLFETIKNIAYYSHCAKCGVYNVKLYSCSQCGKVWYCSRKHQKKDWKLHKAECHAKKVKK